MTPCGKGLSVDVENVLAANLIPHLTRHRVKRHFAVVVPALILIGVREFYAGLFECLVLTDADVSVPIGEFPYTANMGERSGLVEMVGRIQKAERKS